MCHDYLFLEKYTFVTFPKKSLTQVWLVRLFTLCSACESQGEQSLFARNQTRCIVLSRGIKVEVSSSHKWNDAWWCNTGLTTSLQRQIQLQILVRPLPCKFIRSQPHRCTVLISALVWVLAIPGWKDVCLIFLFCDPFLGVCFGPVWGPKDHLFVILPPYTLNLVFA